MSLVLLDQKDGTTAAVINDLSGSGAASSFFGSTFVIQGLHASSEGGGTGDEEESIKRLTPDGKGDVVVLDTISSLTSDVNPSFLALDGLGRRNVEAVSDPAEAVGLPGVVADEAGEGHEGFSKTGLTGTQANAAISTDELLGVKVTKNGRLLLVRHVERLLEHEKNTVEKSHALVVTLHVHDGLGIDDELARNSEDLRSSLGKTDFLVDERLDLSGLEFSERGVAVGPPFSLLLRSADTLGDATSEIAGEDDAITSPLAGIASEHLLQVPTKETEEIRVTQSKADDSSTVTVVDKILADLVNHLLRERNELAVVMARE